MDAASDPRAHNSAKENGNSERGSARRAVRFHVHQILMKSAMTELGGGRVRNMACCCR
jgi:hypothetical protein